VEVQESARHLEDRIAHPLTCICLVYVLSARLRLELSECKVVPTL
jgi:hypothetical protein